MSMIAPLQIAICLAFIFAMFSLLVTAVQELIASAVKLRALTFVSGLRQILGAVDPNPAHHAARPEDKISIVGDFRSFMAGSLHGPDLFKDVVAHPIIQGSSTRKLPSYSSARSFTIAVLDVLSQNQKFDLAGVEAGILKLPEGPTKTALTALLKDADGEIAAFRTALATWFDDAMDRVSGTYKRWSQAIGLGIGFLLAAVLNVDTLTITSALTDAGLQRDIIAAADHYRPETAAGMDAVAKAYATLAALPLPIGYPSGANLSWLTPFGWIITAIAASFGAPFWFDALQRLANLRGAGPKPARADEKA